MPSLRPIAHSEIGLVRKTNQDSGCLSTRAMFVADGMGGAAAGDLASALVIREISPLTESQASGAEAIGLLESTVTRANEMLSTLIGAHPELDGMGTTICGGLFDGHLINIVHIGDSRGYLMNGAGLRRLTHDHSYVQSLVDDGRLDEIEAMNHPHRSLLLKVLNGQTEIQPDYFSIPVRVGDRLMFCSDGMCGQVEDTVIAAALRLTDIHDAMETLVRLAYAAGGTDNITIILADVVADEPGEPVALTEETLLAQPEPAEEHTLPLTPGAQPPSLFTGQYPSSGMIGAAVDPVIVSLLAGLDLSPGSNPAGHSSPQAAEAIAAHLENRGRTSAAGKPGRSQSKALTAAQRERQRYTPGVRKSHKGLILVVLAIVVVVAGAVWGVRAYILTQYYIGENSGTVAIYQGLPGTIAGIQTSRLYEPTQIKLSDLPISLGDKVKATISMSEGGLGQAHSTVQELKSKADQCVADRAGHPLGSPPAADGC